MATNRNTLDTPGAVKKIRTAYGTVTQQVATPVTRKATPASKHEKTKGN